jgi:hypothetical protein
MTSWWVPLLAAAIGAAGALSVALLSQLFQRRRDVQEVQREAQNKTQALLDRYQEPLSSCLRPPVTVVQHHRAGLPGLWA